MFRYVGVWESFDVCQFLPFGSQLHCPDWQANDIDFTWWLPNICYTNHNFVHFHRILLNDEEKLSSLPNPHSSAFETPWVFVFAVPCGCVSQLHSRCLSKWLQLPLKWRKHWERRSWRLCSILSQWCSIATRLDHLGSCPKKCINNVLYIYDIYIYIYINIYTYIITYSKPPKKINKDTKNVGNLDHIRKTWSKYHRGGTVVLFCCAWLMR